jgi:methyl halide transferase
MQNSDKDYWEDRWQQQQTGWDLGEVSPPLKQYIDGLADKNLSILIPGCGNAYEAEYLLRNGFTNITLIDIAPAAVVSLTQKLLRFIQSGNLLVLNEDFFEHSGKYDLILEQTFFCAVRPKLRTAYAHKMSELLNEGGKLVGLLFDKNFEGGPPFGGKKEEYVTYFKPFFQQINMAACYNSIAPRAGTELFIQIQK